MAKPVSLDEYQKFAVRIAADKELRDKRTAVVYGLGLKGESGEFADIIKKILAQGFRLEASQDKLVKEAGDFYWYVAMTAHQLNINLSAVMNVDTFGEILPVESPEACDLFSIGQELLKLDRYVLAVNECMLEFSENNFVCDELAAIEALHELFVKFVFIVQLLGFNANTIAQKNIEKLKERFQGEVFSVEKAVNRVE